ncbi:MAG: hypothetical protein JSS04_18580 [Proteobacteria bacterium]|nr:hypothetical protein [Pseudomonadota bacterium]
MSEHPPLAIAICTAAYVLQRGRPHDWVGLSDIKTALRRDWSELEAAVSYCTRQGWLEATVSEVFAVFLTDEGAAVALETLKRIEREGKGDG